MAVAAVVAIIEAVLDAFGISIFGGGGSRPTLPPMLYRFFHYVAAKFLGLLPCLAPNMYDSAAVEAAAIFAPPFAAISDNPPSTSGNPYGGHLTKAAEYRKPPPPEFHNGTPKTVSPTYSCNPANLTIGASACLGLGIPCVGGIAGAPEDVPLAPAIKAACSLGALGCLGLGAEVMCCMHPTPACNSPDRDLSNWSNW
ncbi:hypothetical protein IMX07_10330 [bacterium]|nr:hypothetical protein [bacterium]